MGYCIKLVDINASFPVKNAKQVLEAIKGLGALDWVTLNFLEIKDITEMFTGWGWSLEKHGKDYHITEFLRDRLGSDEELFNVIAPFMNDGFIEINGEDENHWKWIFENGTLKEISAKVIWEDEYYVFINKYDKNLPKELKERLYQWKVAEEL